MRTASIAASKQSPGERGATIGTGASPLRPNIACSRSACSVLVGRPVDGPPRWTSTIDQRQLERHRETDRLGLERHARPGRRGHAEHAAVRRPEGGTDAGDLVLGLERHHAEPLVLAELVEDVRRRGDRVRPQEQRDLRALRGGDQAVRQGEVARHVAVAAGRHRGGQDLVLDREVLGGLAVRPAGLERRDVGGEDVGLLGELLLEERRACPRSGGGTATRAGRARTCSSRARPPSC